MISLSNLIEKAALDKAADKWGRSWHFDSLATELQVFLDPCDGKSTSSPHPNLFTRSEFKFYPDIQQSCRTNLPDGIHWKLHRAQQHGQRQLENKLYRHYQAAWLDLLRAWLSIHDASGCQQSIRKGCSDRRYKDTFSIRVTQQINSFPKELMSS